MLRMDDKIKDFLKDVMFSDEVSRSIKEDALDLILADETKGIKPFVIGNVLVTSSEFDRVKVAYENIGGNGSSKIMAIKVLREISGLGLKHTKDAVEEWINSDLKMKVNPKLCQ